jgi:hypothetical protein
VPGGGLPPGVYNVVTGKGSVAGAALAEHSRPSTRSRSPARRRRAARSWRPPRERHEDHPRAGRQVPEHRVRRLGPRRRGARRPRRHLLQQGRGLRRRLAALRRGGRARRAPRQGRGRVPEVEDRRSARSHDARRTGRLRAADEVRLSYIESGRTQGASSPSAGSASRSATEVATSSSPRSSTASPTT